MSWRRRVTTLLVGLLAGLVAASCMLLVMVAGRTWLGISPLPEMVPDRIAPTLSIREFFDLFARYGGYNGLKRFGIISGIRGVVGVGAVVGLLYPLLAESRWSRRRGAWLFGVSRLGSLVIGALVLVMWIGTLFFLLPVLQTNYRGLPPTPARIVNVVAILITYLVFAIVLLATYHWVTRRPQVTGTPMVEMPRHAGSAPEPDPVTAPVPVGVPGTRRAVVASGIGILAAVPTIALVRQLHERATFAYDGQVYNGPGVQPLVPNDKFYTVTKNVVDPNVTKALWGLQIGGLIDHPHTYDFDEIASLPAVEQESTLMCISNRIGSGLASNAIWTGVPLADLLAKAGVRDGAVEVMLYGADGYTDTFSMEKALDPTTLVVYRMNGEPLPQRHGYPARIIVPGLFGEKNVKWVTGIEVLDHDGKGFYEQQGWGPNFVIPTRSDFFAPKWVRRRSGDVFTDPISRGRPVDLRGRAFAGDRGIGRVEVSVDGGATWNDAVIDYEGSRLTWVFWRYRWTPTDTGDFELVVRATDQRGNLQTSEVRGTAPQGATGLHRVVAHVE
jgi:DMSO/TMAO reductase YedYZ molybdopterin-dependent catalytic subunit